MHTAAPLGGDKFQVKFCLCVIEARSVYVWVQMLRPSKPLLFHFWETDPLLLYYSSQPPNRTNFQFFFFPVTIRNHLNHPRTTVTSLENIPHYQPFVQVASTPPTDRKLQWNSLLLAAASRPTHQLGRGWKQSQLWCWWGFSKLVCLIRNTPAGKNLVIYNSCQEFKYTPDKSSPFLFNHKISPLNILIY